MLTEKLDPDPGQGVGRDPLTTPWIRHCLRTNEKQVNQNNCKHSDYLSNTVRNNARKSAALNCLRMRFNAPRPFLLLLRVPTLDYCDNFVTSFTAAEFRALYSTNSPIPFNH
ncbi:hypothetical protein EVAR_93544_1 [Eumeta japonica]|uniref:Uncharacterized protein n=1 Tax=Eumeta variegata TaxID=151549 RepID=A0A4C1URR3_EUMVA|nr:hypothetical protein EVAR_93544_1 [Eumeta japonica]